MEKDNLDKINTLLEMPYFVVDFLPEQVRPDESGQFFAVEQYYLKCTEKKRLYQKFVDILLKLNCYYDFHVNFHNEGRTLKNPAPETLARRIFQCCSSEKNDMNIIIEEENSMLVVNGDELCMSIYHSSDRLKTMVQTLARAEGLFVWQP